MPDASQIPKIDNLEERAGDAKFFLTLGSGSFILLGILLLLPYFLNYFGLLLFNQNITLASLIAGLGYLLPGIVLFIWGLGKVFHGKDLTFSQVWKARIQIDDVKRTLRFLVFVTFFVILLVVPVLIGLSVLDIMNSIINWALAIFGPLGLYIGVFIVSLFGNFTVIFPIPYLFIILLIALQPGFTLLDGLLLGLVAGAGAAIGETVAWLLGRTQSESLEGSPTGQQILKLRSQIGRGYGGLLIFFYAATPLPDDILLIALGATKYPLWKALLFCFFGKVALALIITLGAQLPFLQPILIQIFGGGSDPIMDTFYLIIGIALIGLFFIPWGKLLEKLQRNSNKLE
ncbi:MAG: VTT domain-containing protein [Promethearchaeota archaeon]